MKETPSPTSVKRLETAKTRNPPRRPTQPSESAVDNAIIFIDQTPEENVPDKTPARSSPFARRRKPPVSLDRPRRILPEAVSSVPTDLSETPQPVTSPNSRPPKPVGGMVATTGNPVGSGPLDVSGVDLKRLSDLLDRLTFDDEENGKTGSDR